MKAFKGSCLNYNRLYRQLDQLSTVGRPFVYIKFPDLANVITIFDSFLDKVHKKVNLTNSNMNFINRLELFEGLEPPTRLQSPRPGGRILY